MADALTDLSDALDLPRYRVPAPRKSATTAQVPVAVPATPSPTEGSSVPETTVIRPAAATTADAAPTAVHRAAAPPAEQVHEQSQHTKIVTREHARPDLQEGHDAGLAAGGGTKVDYRAKRRTARRATTGWIIGIVVLALIMGLAGWWLGSGRMIDIPAVQGMDRAAAAAAVETAGATVETRGEYSDAIPIDTVLGTDPAAGSQVPRGDTVALLVSLGRPTVPGVPGGGDRNTIEDELRRRTFEPVDGGTAFSASVPEGAVAALDPAPGTVLPVGAKVEVIISKGAAPVELPDLLGLTVDAARAALEKVGLTVQDEREVFDPDVDAGRVSGSDPAEGDLVGPGGTVTLLVSNAVKVPSMMGRSVGSSREELERLGLGVEVRQLADSDRSIVIGQSPGASSRTEPGSTVVLTAVP